jgi:hypothetical protein
MMDFGLSFSYVFKDKEWFGKVAVPALCSLIPVVGQFIVMGWGLKATKNVIDGHVENALPKLDFGADLGRGFMAWLITAIYSIPAAIVVGIAGLLFSFSDGVYEEAVRVILMIVGGCFGFIGVILAILIGFMGMAAVANYVAKGQFSAAFKLSEVFGLVKKSFVSWLLVLLGGVLALGIIAPLGVVICFIGALFTSAYATAVYSHLLGQAYNKSATPVLAEVEVL